MKKTKEECLLMNGILSVDLGKNEQGVFKAMDDYTDSFKKELKKGVREMNVDDNGKYVIVEMFYQLIDDTFKNK